MERKKLKDLTWKEVDKCGEIEKIAYRGDTMWMQYDEEAGFNRIRQKNPKVYEEIEIMFSDNWLIIFLEQAETIDLLDAARANIGDNQEKEKQEYRQCIQDLINKGKEIRTLVKSDTAYYSFVKMAAAGEIEMKKDSEEIGGRLHELKFVKADENADLTKQIADYSKKLEEFNKNKEEYKRKREQQAERYMTLNPSEGRKSGFDR